MQLARLGMILFASLRQQFGAIGKLRYCVEVYEEDPA
jgi:hypothetical protein